MISFRAKKTITASRKGRVFPLGWSYLLFAMSSVVQAQGFSVLSVDTEVVKHVYRLSARFDYQLSLQVHEALKNGIPIILQLDIEILRPRRYYLWAEEIASLKQRYRLQYHALSRQYLVTNLNSGVRSYYQAVSTAVSSLQNLVDLPILDGSLLDPEQNYIVRLRTGIDIDALPVPLRLFAYFSFAWRLTSDWFSQPL